MTPYARKRLQPREHRTPRRLRPQPGLERPQHLMIAATIPDELAARVPGYITQSLFPKREGEGAPPEGWSAEPSSREIWARQEPRPPRKPSFGTAFQSS